MSDLPKTQKAIIIQDKANAKVVSDAPVPELRDEYILIKTTAGKSLFLTHITLNLYQSR